MTKDFLAIFEIAAGQLSHDEWMDRDLLLLEKADEDLVAMTQMVDPWPAASGRRNIAFSGEKAATASERYRTGRIIQPVNATTSGTYVAQQSAQPTASTQPSSSSNAGSNNSNSPTK